MNQRAAFSRDLLAELPLWEQKGWISAEQATLLRGQYAPGTVHTGAWWQLVLSLFAMLCVSAGVIALFAANWADLSREVRVVLSLTPLALAQLALLYALYARPQSIAWRECSALVLALAVGAAIALVAQTYHIEANPPLFLRTWILLVLPLPYLARSWAVAFFAAFLVHVFGFAALGDGLFYRSDISPWEYPAGVLALLPWLLWQRQRDAPYHCQRHVWRTFIAGNGMVSAFVLCSEGAHGNSLTVWLCLAAWYLAARTLGWRNAMTLVFQLALAFILLFFDLMQDDRGITFLRTLTPLTAVSAALLVFALWRRKKLIWWDVAFAASGVLLHFLGEQREMLGQAWPWLPTLFVVILGLWRARVALDHSLFVVNAALIWVLMALFARFIADELPLWLKGLVFIGAGAAFFILNLRLARRPQAVATTSGEKS